MKRQVPEYTEDLVSRCRHGEQGAWERLYQAHHPSLYYFLLSLTRSPEVAEDLTQDVFVKLFREIGKLEFRGSLEPWIMRVARNAALDLFRRDRICRCVSLDRFEDQGDGFAKWDGPDPGAEAESREWADGIRRAVDSLPEALKTPLILRHWGDLSYHEISRGLRLPEGTVKSRIFKARRLLSKRIAPDGRLFASAAASL